MTTYTAHTFSLPTLTGISEKAVAEHIKLYEGYVKHFNLISEQLASLKKDMDANNYLIAELRRRQGFEFDGIRSHEYYFGALEGGAQELTPENALHTALTNHFGSVETWREDFINTATTRGVGWAILYYDSTTKELRNYWIDEHHLGHPNGLQTIVALDMWEHAFLLDYLPSEKKKYIEAYLANLNWQTVNKWFETASQ